MQNVPPYFKGSPPHLTADTFLWNINIITDTLEPRLFKSIAYLTGDTFLWNIKEAEIFQNRNRNAPFSANVIKGKFELFWSLLSMKLKKGLRGVIDTRLTLPSAQEQIILQYIHSQIIFEENLLQRRKNKNLWIPKADITKPIFCRES